MTIGWFFVWWIMLNIGVLIYALQNGGIKRSNSLTLELIKMVICIPFILFAYVLVLLGLAPKDVNK